MQLCKTIRSKAIKKFNNPSSPRKLQAAPLSSDLSPCQNKAAYQTRSIPSSLSYSSLLLFPAAKRLGCMGKVRASHPPALSGVLPLGVSLQMLGKNLAFKKKTQFFFGGGGPSTPPAPPGESAPPKRGGGRILPPKSGGGEILLCKKKIDNFFGGGGPSAPLAPAPRGGLRPLPGQGLWPLHLN